MTNPNPITIDGVAYDRDSLTDDAKAQIVNVANVDRRIRDTEADLAILKTARAAYAQALKANLPKN